MISRRTDPKNNKNGACRDLVRGFGEAPPSQQENLEMGGRNGEASD